MRTTESILSKRFVLRITGLYFSPHIGASATTFMMTLYVLLRDHVGDRVALVTPDF